MAEEAAEKSPDVMLGFDAAWGYAPADQTSPALAAAAGALIDTTMTGEGVTELRIHGVSGSNGPTMLEHPQRSEEHTSELQSQSNIECRLLLEKNNTTPIAAYAHALLE